MAKRVNDPRAHGVEESLPLFRKPITPCPFEFDRDTLTFANELVWEYRPDPLTGRMRPRRNERPPEYTHRCFVMARSVRQFFYHARFEPDQPVATPEVYRSLIRAVVRRSPRFPSAHAERVGVPGYGSLRALSHAQTALLKAECGPPRQSYFVWSHWRMVFPIWRRHQERVADRLLEALRTRPPPIVHLFRFPRITINHALVLFGATESERDVQFDAYDPNIPAHPVKLHYDRVTRTFSFPPTHYWGGGPVSVTEAYSGWPY
jgi:hypothetical protein